MRKLKRRLILFTAFIGVWACSTPTSTPPLNETDRLLREFAFVAFGVELGQDVPQRIRKWQAPVRVAFPPDMPADLRAPIARHTAELAAITGHDIRLAMPTEGNLFVAVVAPANLADAVGRVLGVDGSVDRDLLRANCFFLTKLSDSHAIEQSHVFIRADLPNSKKMHCISEEITQSLGLMNDSYKITNSMFNDNFTGSDLSNKDHLFLRILYSQIVYPGMTLENLATYFRDCVERDAFSNPATWQQREDLLPCR